MIATDGEMLGPFKTAEEAYEWVVKDTVRNMASFGDGATINLEKGHLTPKMANDLADLVGWILSETSTEYVLTKPAIQ